MITLQQVELGVLGQLQVRQYGLPVAIPGAKPRAILTMLGLHGGSVVSADTLVELLWGDDPPRTAAKALQTHISHLRRTLGDGFVLTQGTGWTLSTTEIDATRYKVAARLGRDAITAGDAGQAAARFDEALTLWRGVPELPDGPRGTSEKTRWIEGHAALVEDRADALLATGRAAEIVGELEAAVADAPLRERRWGHLMLAFYRAGRQGEALGAYQRVRSLLADQLGVDPGPDLRRLEAAIVTQDAALEMPVSQQLQSVTRAVTFLLTDIEGSTAAWEADADAMAVALARHDEIVEQVVTSRGGRLIKTRGEGDATFSVFDRPSAAAAGAIELQEAIFHEPWALAEPMRIRVALHTGEVELRDGDYFGRAVNRAARLRSLAVGGQILCSGATAELVIDTLPDDVVLADLGMRQLKNLPRPEHVFELRLENADDLRAPATEVPIERPGLPAVLAGPGPFVGRGPELERLLSAWQTTLAAGTSAVLIAGEPGVGKTRLAGEWSRHAYEQGAVVLYGRCDEDLGAPYQPFAEALRSLVPCLGAKRLRGLRGVEALLPLVPGLTDALPDLAAPTRADPDTERYALFDAVVALLGVASTSAPVVLILDDLHWAAKPTLLLLRHLLRFGEHARVQIVGTYRSTDLDRSHPLAAMLADLHRDGSAHRLALSGLDEGDVTTYVAEAGYDDEELARALATVTGGNPFFLIEALRHVDESGGRWDPSTLPQGVREAVSRRLSRLPAETNKALAAAAVVGSRFALALVESVVGEDLIDAFDEASKAGIVIEEPGGRYRFNHAIVRQSLLAELASVRRMRLHQKIAATLETEPGADDELLAELAYHYFECAWAGNAAKAVEYCRRAADQAMARLAYEGAADLYDRAWHALEEIDDELPDRDEQQAELLVARCEALLAAGDVVSARGAVSQLQEAARNSGRLAAWGTCFDGQLSMLTDPERLDEIESAVGAAAEKLAELDDAAGEAKAHTVRAGCLARLGRIGDAETALDQALTAARRAREHRRVNAVLANAPLAALWGPNPVPRAGGRCLDVVRLLRITTGSPVVEATSTRCQGVLDAFRGRAAAGRQLIDSARRTLTELGMRHARLEVDQFAGIVELVVDDPAAAEPHLRRAYAGFRRMGLDVDTAETAALLARACLALDRDADADELCTESEHLAGHALKASIAWRTVRAELSARRGAHDEARRVAEEAVAVAEGTDLLVDHGDACLALATVLGTAGDVAGARAAADRAVELYELKGAVALADRARRILDAEAPTTPGAAEPPLAELDNACVRAIRTLEAAFDREAWGEVEQLHAPDVFIESRRKIVGFKPFDLPSGEWPDQLRRFIEMGWVRHRNDVVAVRGERLALTRLDLGTADVSPGAPQVEVLTLFGLDTEGRIALQVSFDIDDMDAAVAELDAAYARLEERQRPAQPLENAASRADARFNALFADRRFDEIGAMFIADVRLDDRRQGLRRESTDRDTAVADIRTLADVGATNMTSEVIATRGERLALVQTRYSGRDQRPEAFHTDLLRIAEVDADGQTVAYVAFDPDDFDSAFEELDARYLAGEAAGYARVWQSAMDTLGEANRHEPGPIIRGLTYVDHRRVSFGSGNFGRAVEELWALVPDARYRVTEVHALDAHGTVASLVIEGTDSHGNKLEWCRVVSLVPDEPRMDVYEENDVDTALARFEELRSQARKLENTASQVAERFLERFAAGDWDAIAEMLADDFVSEDRRPVVGAGIRHGRDVEIASIRAGADLGGTNMTSPVIATRGERLILTRTHHSGRDQAPDAFRVDALAVVEIDADERIVARIVFDPDDLEGAFAELDARYLAGEAAPYAHTWSVIARAIAAFNRHELPEFMPGWVNIDHRRARWFAPGDLTAYIRATLDLAPDVYVYIEGLHQLSNLGAVFTQVTRGTSQDGFDAEWREIVLATIEGDLINRIEVFDEADIDAVLARFDELSRRAPRLENAASQVAERFLERFAAREWDAMAEILADDYSSDDRRRVVNAGIQHGRDAEIRNMQTIEDLWLTNVGATVIATRGGHLTLMRARYSGRDQAPEAFITEILGVIEINADDRISALVVFDLDDIDAAFEELDARYLAGEAAAHGRTWSVIAGAIAAVNRHELPESTPDWVNIDHRRAIAFAPGDMTAYVHATWDDGPEGRAYIEAVHRLSTLGAIVTQVGREISPRGFEAEWRMLNLLTIDGDRFNRCELFDEADIDAALARFDELTQPTPRLENTASRVVERVLAAFANRDWDSISETLGRDLSSDDRRRVVNSGVRNGRDALIDEILALADVGVKEVTSSVIATRGERLILNRLRSSGSGERADAFFVEALDMFEIDDNERILARVTFDPNDFDAAFEELDARYLAGEASGHAHAWSVIAGAYAAINRRELAATTPDCVNIDHRRGTTIAPGDLISFIRASWDLDRESARYIETVHRLNNLGAVVTHQGFGTSQEGFAAEWRCVTILTVEGDMISRSELFDEADLDAALARFDELNRPALLLENAASRVYGRLQTSFAARDWVTMTEVVADDISTEDRRRIVGAGPRRGRAAAMALFRAIAETGATTITSVVIATRGTRLALCRTRVTTGGPDGFAVEAFQILEIDAEERLAAVVTFDPDDIDAAFDELDARYLAGEASAQAHTWSAIARTYAEFNRHGLVPDWVSVDHRRGSPFVSGDLNATIRASRELTPNLSIYVETVHRLSSLGAVVTNMSFGTSHEGFAAEWRMIQLLTVEGDRISRLEIFDEADLDAALAKFEQLAQPAPQLKNAASQADERFRALFAARDWETMADLMADDTSTDDRRPLMGVGVRCGRDTVIADWRATADVGVKNLTSAVIATRGECLVLSRYRFSGRDQRPEAFRTDVLGVVEIDSDQRLAACTMFDLDDIDAAFAELDARYVTGEAAAHAHTWSVIAQGHTAFNRRELPAKAPELLDHRPLVTIEAGDPTPTIREMWDFTPDLRIYIEAVHRLSDLGAVFTQASRGTSQAGFDAEWRIVELVTIDGDLVNSGELFDEADIDAAMARFDEISRPAPQLENAASRADDRFFAYFAARDWAGIAEILTDDSFVDDRSRVVNVGFWDGRDAVIANVRALAEAAPDIPLTVIATRGERLALTRMRSPNRDPGHGDFASELLIMVEIDTDDRIAAHVVFDVDNIDAAFAELDARYIAGEAAAHARTWSVIARTYATFNQRELPPTTPDWVNIDNRRATSFAPGDTTAYLRATWDVAPNINIYIEVVHRLSDVGGVITHAAHGTSQEGFDAEWREITVLTVDGDLINRGEIFDEADIDAALARFDELNRHVPPPLENKATRVNERFTAYFAAPDWAAMAEMVADDMSNDDRRPLVGAGVRNGRDAEIANVRTIVDIGVTNPAWFAIATRGERLALGRVRLSGRDQRPEAFHTDVLGIVEIDTANRIAARVWFELNDIDAAFAELDARYIAGEAAAHGSTWSLISEGFAALNRREVPATTLDFVNVDHRPVTAVEPGDLVANLRAVWDQVPDISLCLEAVHRLSDVGAVVTQAVHGTSREGFEAEWREIHLVTLEGELFNRSEMFDEADLDAALARFDELNTPTLANAATQARARQAEAFNRRNLDGFLAGYSTAEARYEDRRKGLRDDAAGPGLTKRARALFEAPKRWRTEMEPVAIRGSRLALTRDRYRDTDSDRTITAEHLTLTEVGDDNLVHRTVLFDPDDINGAMAELTSHWIASGEVAHPKVIEAVGDLFEATNRHDWDTFAALSAGAMWVNHRQLSNQGVKTVVDHMPSIRTMASLVPDYWVVLADVLAHSPAGVVGDVALRGTSTDGLAIEIPLVVLVVVDRDRVTGFEVFDPEQRDVALARFEELNQPT